MAEDPARKPSGSPAQPSSSQPSPPTDAFLVVPVRNMVLFPEIVTPMTIGRPRSVAAVQQAVREQRQVVIVLQRDPEVAEPAAGDLHAVGTIANILRYVTAPDGEHHLICQGVQRFRISRCSRAGPIWLPADCTCRSRSKPALG